MVGVRPETDVPTSQYAWEPRRDHAALEAGSLGTPLSRLGLQVVRLRSCSRWDSSSTALPRASTKSGSSGLFLTQKQRCIAGPVRRSVIVSLKARAGIGRVWTIPTRRRRVLVFLSPSPSLQALT